MRSVLNLARLQRKLARLPVAAKLRIRAAMEEIANRIVAMMKSIVAKDDGDLHDSIGWTWGKAPKGSLVLARVKASLGGELTLTIFAGNEKAYYARWVEFGTSEHVIGGLFTGSKHPGTAAQPFFYVSWRTHKRGAARAILKATRDAAKQVAAGS